MPFSGYCVAGPIVYEKPTSPVIVLSALRKIHECSFINFSTFKEFREQFDKRCEKYNDLSSNDEISDAHRSLLFMGSLGPMFDNWLLLIDKTYSVAGHGSEGTHPMSYEDLCCSARMWWIEKAEMMRHGEKEPDFNYLWIRQLRDRGQIASRNTEVTATQAPPKLTTQSSNGGSVQASVQSKPSRNQQSNHQRNHQRKINKWKAIQLRNQQDLNFHYDPRTGYYIPRQ